MALKLLLVEDDQAIRQMLHFILTQSGHEITQAENSKQAMDSLTSTAIDLMILDWMLPGISGLEFCKKIKKDLKYKDLPVIMLTARTEDEYKIQGLNAGADDYITKPFSPRELIARINAVLRRTGNAIAVDKIMEINGLILDESNHRVMSEHIPIDVGPTEFKLLRFLMSHPDRVFTRMQLLDNIWRNSAYIEERTIDVHIRRLRKALEKIHHDRLIQTVRGAGYRFSAQ